MSTNNNMVRPVHLPNITVASQGFSGVTRPEQLLLAVYF